MREQIAFARGLRREPTAGERRFWTLLEPWRANGWHWRRQAPVGPYVVDFVCKRIGLVVEIDGDSHYTEAGQRHDARRTAYLGERGYSVLRFSNEDALTADLYEVMREVLGEPDAGP
jgi:very-short-patch-repair endonuclease